MVVNKIGPELFKDFDKIRFLRKDMTPNKSSGRGQNTRSYTHSKTDYEISYQDELEINRAFSCLAELENI